MQYSQYNIRCNSSSSSSLIIITHMVTPSRRSVPASGRLSVFLLTHFSASVLDLQKLHPPALPPQAPALLSFEFFFSFFLCSHFAVLS